jgi:hypothetical protein
MLSDELTCVGFRGLGYSTQECCVAQLRLWASKYHEAFRLSQSASRWADKTPQYSFILPELLKLFGNEAQFVIVVRHPFDVIYSIFTRGWRLGAYDDDLLSNTAKYVVAALEAQQRFIEQHKEHCHQYTYEALIENPEGTLRKVFSFLGEVWEPSVLDYHVHDHNFGTEDPIVRGASGFVRNFGNWRRLEKEQLDVIRNIAGDTAESLGYAVQ